MIQSSRLCECEHILLQVHKITHTVAHNRLIHEGNQSNEKLSISVLFRHLGNIAHKIPQVSANFTDFSKCDIAAKYYE